MITDEPRDTNVLELKVKENLILNPKTKDFILGSNNFCGGRLSEVKLIKSYNYDTVKFYTFYESLPGRIVKLKFSDHLTDKDLRIGDC